jgi:hypothetical protein
MSRFRDGIYSTAIAPTNGNGRFAYGGDAPPAEEQTAKPPEGEGSGTQSNDYGWLNAERAGWWGAATDCNGAEAANPCGFPWYGQLYRGTYVTYDWMLEHPVIAHARSQLFDPIIAGGWGYEVRKGTPQDRSDFIRGVMEDLRAESLADIVRAADYGWAGFEKVWKIIKGQWVLTRLKPVAWEGTQLLKDRFGNFAGLVPPNRINAEDWFGVHKSFLFTHDGKAGRLHGRAKLENLRAVAWRDWLDAAVDLLRLGRKISGIMPIVYTPPGSFKTPSGEMITWKANADAMLKAARNGLGVHLTHLGAQNPTAGVTNFEQLLALIKASAVRLDVQDFGNNAPAIAGTIDRMKHCEEMFYHGYGFSPRTGMPTDGGTKADAGTHTDTSDKTVENLHGAIARALNRQVVDDLLYLNFGPDAIGSVRIVPAKLSDDNRDVDMAVLSAILADPMLRPQYIEQLDNDAITDRRGLPKADGVTIKLEAVPADNTLNDQNAQDTLPGDGQGP